ncbi:MAG TPA: hypothetical protein VHS75_21550 [Phenylobacterium sp.]|nr:hypothetical protein [Phenylobacterium sp.]
MPGSERSRGCNANAAQPRGARTGTQAGHASPKAGPDGGAAGKPSKAK